MRAPRPAPSLVCVRARTLLTPLLPRFHSPPTRTRTQILTADASHAWTSRGVFAGSRNCGAVVRCALPAPTPARHVRVAVLEWNEHISLRWDVEVVERKAGQVRAEGAEAAQQRWRHVCSEDEAVVGVAVGSLLRYGAGESWVELAYTPAIARASNACFGRDPVPGVRKVCQVLTEAP